MTSKEALLHQYNNHKYRLLAVSIAVDLVGMVSYLAPGLGELADLAWAPIAGAINWMLFKGRIGFFGGAFAFAEELLPGVDLIPSTTINWTQKYVIQNEKSMREFFEKKMKEEQLLDEYEKTVQVRGGNR